MSRFVIYFDNYEGECVSRWNILILEVKIFKILFANS